MSKKEKNIENNQNKFDLKEHLIDYGLYHNNHYAIRIINVSEQLEKLTETKADKHISFQMLRSGTTSTPNYGEVQSAEYKADFIHKMKKKNER